MSLKDLVVFVDASKGTPTRVEFAAALADKFDSHAIGVFVKPPAMVPAYVMAQIPPEARKIHDDSLEEMAQKAASVFNDRMRAAMRHDRSEWRVVHGDPTAAMALMGRYADLVVMGQHGPDEDEIASGLDGDELVLSCGRPVLLVPHSYRIDTVGERVLIAWNASREAARAVADAMPILERAKQVTVLCINPPPSLGDEPGADIALHLARHGVKAEAAHIFAHDIEPGDALLSRAADLSADLIVMGAYGRPRLRELILGGVTRQMLQQMTVPVLMAH